MMRLCVRIDEINDEVVVWAENVPEDISDEDVEYSFRQAANAGDSVAKRAFEIIPGPWMCAGWKNGKCSREAKRFFYDGRIPSRR